MPEMEGYIGIISLLNLALDRMDDGPAKALVIKARDETIRQAQQSVSSLEIGMELGQYLSEEE
jgi:hypothetical protein